MIPFDFKSFLFENRKSPNDLAKLLSTPLRSISIMINRGTVKPSFVALIETHFGDCSAYIKQPNSKIAETV